MRARNWEADSDKGANKCNLVSKNTKYSLYNKDDYKRCISDAFGNGAEDARHVGVDEAPEATTPTANFVDWKEE